MEVCVTTSTLDFSKCKEEETCVRAYRLFKIQIGFLIDWNHGLLGTSALKNFCLVAFGEIVMWVFLIVRIIHFSLGKTVKYCSAGFQQRNKRICMSVLLSVTNYVTPLSLLEVIEKTRDERFIIRISRLFQGLMAKRKTGSVASRYAHLTSDAIRMTLYLVSSCFASTNQRESL